MIDLGYHPHIHISYEGQAPPLCIGALHRDDGMWTVAHPIGGYYSFHPDTDPFTVTDDCRSAARPAVNAANR